MASDALTSRLRALLWAAPVAAVITLAILLATTRIGPYAGAWFVDQLEQRPELVALGLMCLSGLPLVFVTWAERRRSRAGVR